MKKLLIPLVLLLIVVGAYVALASSVGPNSPSTTVDDATVGTQAWINPNNAQASDGVYTTSTASSGGSVSHYLKATNFGFSIPAGATINGILVEVQKKGSIDGGSFNLDYVTDGAVKIITSSGSVGTTNKADTTTHWPITEAYISYGSSVDLWGQTWAASDINSANFGLAFEAFNNYFSTEYTTASIDHIRITVSYTVNGVNQVQIRSGNVRVKSGTLIIK